MLKVKHFEQTTSHTCGAAALKILLSFWGQDFEESELVKLCGTTKYGTPHAGLVKAIKKLGFIPHYQQKASLSDLEEFILKKKIPVVVNWFSIFGKTQDGHYSVVIGLSKKSITLSDPEVKKPGIRKLKRNLFEKYWYDYSPDGQQYFYRCFLTALPKN